jgi:hypothetical protein
LIKAFESPARRFSWSLEIDEGDTPIAMLVGFTCELYQAQQIP